MPRTVEAKETCRAISALPATISEPGRHCLAANLRSRIQEGAAITVLVDGVTLDLKGHRLSGAQGTATAIEAVGRRGITVRDGIIAGFGQGIRLAGKRSGHHLVERLTVEGVAGVAVWVEGRHNVVRENHLVGIAPRPAAEAWGIVARGPLSRLLDNDIQTRVAGTGVELSEADGAIIERNVVSGGGGSAEATGVRVLSASDVLIIGNELRELRRGVVFVNGDGLSRANVMKAVDQPWRSEIGADRGQ